MKRTRKWFWLVVAGCVLAGVGTGASAGSIGLEDESITWDVPLVGVGFSEDWDAIQEPSPASLKPEGGPELLSNPFAGADAVAQQPVGSLSDIVVYTSAGHGFAYDSSAGWISGRKLYNGIVEDIGNVDQLNYFADYCFKAGATVVPMRPLGQQTNEVVLDNMDTSVSERGQVTFGGAWNNSTAGLYYGNPGDAVSYRYAAINPTETTAWATYRPILPEAGFYPVYTWVRSGSDRVRQLYRVEHSGGLTDVRVNHRQAGYGMVWLGTYYFDAGTNGSVSISNYSPGEYDANNPVVIADAIRFGNGMGDIVRGSGVSGLPRELEASRYWIQGTFGQGLDAAIYDHPSWSDVDDNVGAPTRLAYQMQANSISGFYGHIYLGFHSNGGNGSNRGPMGLWDTQETNPIATEQKDYALGMANHLAAALNNGQNGVWFPDSFVNNTANSFGASFGEIRQAERFMNMTILEVLHHDNAEDAKMLRCPSARRVIGMAAAQGIVKYLAANTLSVSSVLFPAPPTHVSAVNSGAGQVTLRWQKPVKHEGFGDDPTGYVVYQSGNGYGFGKPVSVAGGNTTQVTLSGLSAGQVMYFQVCAVNEGGESLASKTVGVRVSPTGVAPHLVVNGFERNEKAQSPTDYIGKNIHSDVTRVIQRRINSQDYVIQHGNALAAAGQYFDSCDNDAVQSGSVALGDYFAAYWQLGRESQANKTFNETERTLVGSFLNAGGRLMVSGTDLLWDLGRTNSAEQAFVQDVLRVGYGADDAETGAVAGIAGGPFAGLGSFSFDYAGTGSTYRAAFPDRLTTAGSPPSVGALAYGAASSGNLAAVAFSNANQRVVVMGFPFETIYSESARNQLMAKTVEFFGVIPEGDPEPPILSGVFRSQGFDDADEHPWNWSVAYLSDLNDPMIETHGAGVAVTTNKTRSGSANALQLWGSTDGSANPTVVFGNVDLTDYFDVQLSIPYAANGPDSGDDLHVAVSYDGGATWTGESGAWGTQIADGYNNLKLDYDQFISLDRQPAGANPYVLDIDDAVTQLMVRVTFYDADKSINTNDFYYLDEIELSGSWFGESDVDTDGDGIPDWWEMEHFGDLTTADGESDSDKDGMSDLEEYIAGTDPKDADSILQITAIESAGTGAVRLEWPSAAGRKYSLWRTGKATNEYQEVTSGIEATPDVNEFIDIDLPEGMTFFYFIKVKLDE